MPEFRFSARDGVGKAHNGILAAQTSEELEGLLRDQGMFLVDAREVAAGSAEKASRHAARDQKMSLRRLIEFTTELESTYTAGLALVQALDDLAKEEDNPQLSAIFASVNQRIKEGSGLSEA